MEYHNRNLTPRDRLDEEFIRELLELEFDGYDNGRNASSCSCAAGNGQSRNRGESRCGSSTGHTGRSISSGNTNRCGERRRTEQQINVRNEQGTSCGCSENACGCGRCEGFRSPRLEGVPLSMVYSPYQEWEALHEVEEALDRGTLFRCLEFPFYHARCSKKSCDNSGRSSCGCRK